MMVLDYHDKKASREGQERKPLQKNRPRKSSSVPVALLSVAALTLIFGAGVGTGWFLHKATHSTAPIAVAQTPKKVEPAQAPAQPPPAPDAPLTFYKTLPAGGKAVMGSGLNLKKPEPQGSAPHAATPAAPTVAPAAPAAPSAPAAAAPAAEKQAEQKQAEQKQSAAPQYLVQVASYRNKTEAEAAQAKLTTKGFGAYVVESKVTDKGTWYRLRIGKHLSKGEAEELAGKAGKGAVIIQE